MPRLIHLAVRSAAVALAATAVVLTAVPGIAHAADNGEWAVVPTTAPNSTVRRATFQLNVRPGETVSDGVEIVNTTARYLRFTLFAADAYNTPNAGAFALRGINDKSPDLAPWVHLPVKQFTSPPHSETNVPFTVAVPIDASPGDHVGGIVALDEAPQTTHAGAVALNVKRAVGVRMYVRVAGPVHSALVVTSLNGHAATPLLAPATGTGRGAVSYTITNDGNVVTGFTATIRVTDVFGRTVKSFTAKKVEGLVPKQAVTFNVRWSGLPAFGLRLQAHVAIAAGSASTSAATSFFAIPWLIVFLVVIIATGLVVRRLRRRALPPAAGRPNASPSPRPDRDPVGAGSR